MDSADIFKSLADDAMEMCHIRAINAFVISHTPPIENKPKMEPGSYASFWFFSLQELISCGFDKKKIEDSTALVAFSQQADNVSDHPALKNVLVQDEFKNYAMRLIHDNAEKGYKFDNSEIQAHLQQNKL